MQTVEYQLAVSTYASAVMQRGRHINAGAACREHGATSGWLHCEWQITLINQAIEQLVPLEVIRAASGAGVRA